MRLACLLLSACAVLTLSAGNANAQRASVAAVQGWSSHDLLERPSGISASVGVPLTRRIAASMTVDRLESRADGVGVVCGGLINPDQCPVEPFTQTGRLLVVGIGAELLLLDARRVEIAVRPELLLGRVESAKRAPGSGSVLKAEKGQLGVGGGAELRVVPVGRAPIQLIGGATFKRLGPQSREILLDGYTPFHQWYSLRTVYGGVAIRRELFAR